MPFTISHAVLAPPLAKLTGYRLPISALAIGSMTPDLYRLFTSESYEIAHQWQGLIFPNLLIGLGFCLLWYALYRPVIFRWIGITKPLDCDSFDKMMGFILSVIMALIVGISSHLIWDGLTHSDFRTFAFDHFLNRPVSLLNHIYPMHRVLQIGTSILALPFMLWMGIHYYFKYRQLKPISSKIKISALCIVLISLLTAAYYYLQFLQTLGSTLGSIDLYSFIGRSVNQFASAFLIVFSLGCVLFLILDKNHRLNK
ncbi:phospholipase [Acinetobacter sp. SFB]|uniref:DUF4184 family protein n=1 Tax=Acinetobacter sp. SFB TaxID=1805634 RepID=UPI0007D78E95|nr:DUF4184 family protein [Acinetobacter sp. SFB]OAL75812.1 phospholipase [Acinetobacter sp. SFB]